jgi:hypothetical protein
MKYFFIGLALILLASCRKNSKITFTGTTPGIKSGTFVIKTLRDSTLYGVNIKDEKFQVSGILPHEGYYIMDIVDDANKSTHDKHFDVYLEGGDYTIQTTAGKPFNYPKITSSAKIQNDLSAYYALVDQQSADATVETAQVNAELDKVNHRTHTTEEFNSKINKLSELHEKEVNAQFDALKIFVKQNPQSTISAYLMSKLDYEDKPADYLAVYNQFSAEAKNSDDGKEIGTKLNHLVKLLPGAQSPDILGKTIDGKPFDKASIKKKVILVEFWRASDQISRLDHPIMINMLQTDFKGKDGFGIVSVDFDAKSDWWTTAVRDDKMTWTQVSDLKGDDSPNATNWAISKIPTYYLVDGNWKIIDRDVQLSEVPILADKYLNKN